MLEHPARSLLWPHAGLPVPGDPRDAFGGFTVQVDQCAWGHVARKTSWLYVVGVALADVLAGVRAGGTPTHWISGFRPSKARNSYKSNGSAVPLGIKVCSAQQRRRTPPAFAEWLVGLVRHVRDPEYRTEGQRLIAEGRGTRQLELELGVG